MEKTMSLLDTFYVKCIHMDKTTVSDGMGGFTHTWVEGATFDCAIVTQASTSQRQAEKVIGAATYQLTVPKTVILDYHDVLKRVSDGKILRITSSTKDVQTPSFGTLDFSQVTAEEWELD